MYCGCTVRATIEVISTKWTSGKGQAIGCLFAVYVTKGTYNVNGGK